jgi:hypothetical protein
MAHSPTMQSPKVVASSLGKRRRAPNRIFLPNSSLAGSSRVAPAGTELCIFADTVVTYGLRYGYGLGRPLCYVRLRLPI